MSLALLVASASFLFVLSPVQTAQATQVGFPLYTWGGTSAAPGGSILGRPVTAENPYNLPGRVGDANNWKFTSTDYFGTFAINIYGELFGWGASWTQDNMGQGGNPGSGIIAVPTQIGTETNWTMVTSRNRSVAAINEDGELFTWGFAAATDTPTRIDTPNHWVYVNTGQSIFYAIDSDGFMYSWAHSTAPMLNQRIGRDTTVVPYSVPGRITVAGQPDVRWDRVVSSATSFTTALTRDGELFTWGNINVGRPAGADHIHDAPINRPGVVIVYGETAPRNNWVAINGTNFHGIALSSNGVVYTWGAPDVHTSVLGRPLGTDHPNNAPANMLGAIVDNNGVPINKFVSIHGGAEFVLAFTNTNQLWSWGSDMRGQLGIGGVSGGYRDRPTFVANVLRFIDAASGGGQQAAMLMEIRFPMTDVDLYKHLQKPEGTPAPNLNFRFTFERNSFNDNSTPADIARIPVIDPVVINPTTVVSPPPPPAGTVTLSGYANILDGIIFAERGIYSWIIREDVTHPSGAGANSTVVFSQASYELRVYVRQEGGGMGGDLYIYYITLHRLTDPVTGVTLNPPLKVDDLTFTNLYTRTTAANQHFEIRKTIEGAFADLSDTFTFEITLTRTALCPENRTFTGRVVDLAGNPVSPPRTYTFTTGVTQNVALGHNQRLIFDGANALTLGSTFLVVEQACSLHVASVRVYSYNTAPSYIVHTNAEPNQARTTYVHTVGANRNAALFTNVNFFTPPTGLFLTSGSPYLVLLATGLLTTAYLSLRARKRIEELPIMH